VHVTAVPPPHVPDVHVVLFVQTLPSSQVVPFVTFVGVGQPVAGTHVPATLQGFVVVHVTAVPFTQAPFVHVVLFVHAFPSSHVVPFARIGHPVAGTQAPPVWHASAVHVTALPPPHVPFVHVVLFVHALPSSHVVPFVLFVGVGQPVAGTQVPAVWHGFVVVQVTALPPPQTPFVHVVLFVHALLSLHVVPFARTGHPVAGTHAPPGWHASAVHVTALPPPHVPFVHVVLLVHAFPSSHVVPFVRFGHPVAGTHVPPVWHASAVHVTALPPPQVPFVHVVPFVHALLSLQVVPLAAFGFEQTPVFASYTPATWHVSSAVQVTVSHGCAIRHTLTSWIDQWFADAVPVCVIRMARADWVRKLIVTSCVLPVPVATADPKVVPSLDSATE